MPFGQARPAEQFLYNARPAERRSDEDSIRASEAPDPGSLPEYFAGGDSWRGHKMRLSHKHEAASFYSDSLPERECRLRKFQSHFFILRQPHFGIIKIFITG